jgi:hypothetical protein
VKDPVYLGDGVYAQDEGFMIKVWTDREDGQHFIYFEPEVFYALVQFGTKIFGGAK